jgi:hypothetical protein
VYRPRPPALGRPWDTPTNPTPSPARPTPIGRPRHPMRAGRPAPVDRAALEMLPAATIFAVRRTCRTSGIPERRSPSLAPPRPRESHRSPGAPRSPRSSRPSRPANAARSHRCAIRRTCSLPGPRGRRSPGPELRTSPGWLRSRWWPGSTGGSRAIGSRHRWRERAVLEVLAAPLVRETAEGLAHRSSELRQPAGTGPGVEEEPWYGRGRTSVRRLQDCLRPAAVTDERLGRAAPLRASGSHVGALPLAVDECEERACGAELSPTGVPGASPSRRPVGALAGCSPARC